VALLQPAKKTHTLAVSVRSRFFANKPPQQLEFSLPDGLLQHRRKEGE